MAAVVFGAVIRLSYLGRVAVEHFDEGVYASNFWFGPEQGYTYPAQHLYAPPLLPTAIEWTMILVSLIGVRPTGFIPMIPSLIAGVAMIPSIWWVGRRWFGPTAGIVSAWLVATSDFHACYSRAALTDVPVCLFLLWAVYFIWSALIKLNQEPSRPTSGKKSKQPVTAAFSWRDIMLASMFTALAWWTKYNGWLPLAIGIAGSALWLMIAPKESRKLVATLKCLASIAAFSFLAWSPVLWNLQSTGGYAAVAANHKQYIVGLKGWTDSAVLQLRHVGMYDDWAGMLVEPPIRRAYEQSHRRIDQLRAQGPIRVVTPPRNRSAIQARVSQAFAQLSQFRFQALDWTYFVSDISLLMLPYLLVSISLALLFVSLAACLWKIQKSSELQARIAACLLLAWLLGMSVSTPFYHPYPRLVFPWLTAIWLGVGLAIDCWRNRHIANLEHLPNPRIWSPSFVEIGFICWMGANLVVRLTFGNAHAWSDRTGTASLAKALIKKIESKTDHQSRMENEVIAYTWGEPALLFAFRAGGLNYVGPVQGLSVTERKPQIPTFIAFGDQAFLGSQFEQERKALDRCEFVTRENYDQSHLVKLDSRNAADFYLSNDSREASATIYPTNGMLVPNLWLYRVKGD